MPAESINCCISSPPYWALRDYGTATWEGGDVDCDHKAPDEAGQTNKPSPGQRQHAGRFAGPNCYKCGAKRIDKQLGLEKTFEEYIDKLCTIYDEVKRVLRPDGTCWVNLGDTYSSGSKGSGGTYCPDGTPYKQMTNPGSRYNLVDCKASVSDKSLCLIPQRFAIEMVNRDWILRNVIIWAKPNPMPSSAKDRFTVDFEYIYFFVKQKKYFFEPIYEPFLTESNAERPRMGQGNQTKYKQKRAEGMGGAGSNWKGHSGSLKADGTQIGNPALGRNKRTVWTIPTQSFAEAHFATFPEKLVEPMILSGCPREVCIKCGKGRRKVYEQGNLINVRHNDHKTPLGSTEGSKFKMGQTGPCMTDGKYIAGWKYENHFKGYTDCGCGVKFRPGVVLDPFWVRARSARSLPRTDETGLALNSNRNISTWPNAA